MKKILRIFFVVFIISIFLLGAYVLYDAFMAMGMIDSLEKDPSLVIVILWTLLTIPSLFFNLEKLGESRKKSTIYLYTRVGDLVFSVYLFLACILGLVSVWFLFQEEGNLYEDSRIILPIVLLVIALIVCALLFIDNFKYHKSFLKIPEEESIDDIGK